MSFEDFENAFYKFDAQSDRITDEVAPVSFVEYFEEDGATYLVISYDHVEDNWREMKYEVFNTKESFHHYAKSVEYNEKHK